MPRLLALIPEDGIAIVLDGDTARWCRAPFRADGWTPMSSAAVEDAIYKAGYTVVAGAPEESWPDVVRRIVCIMSAIPAPSSEELRARLLRSAPAHVVDKLLGEGDQ